MSNKIQTITIQKVGSSWTDVYEALSELRRAVEDCNDYQANMLDNVDTVSHNLSLNEETQTVTEVRTWTERHYNIHRDLIADYEDNIQQELETLGWSFEESVVDG